jgi:hypothetical protein
MKCVKKTPLKPIKSLGYTPYLLKLYPKEISIA